MTTTSRTDPPPTSSEPGPVPPPGPPRRRLVRLAAVLGVVVAGIMVARVVVDRLQPHLYAGTVLQSPTPAPAMDGLRLASGQPLELDRFAGDVVLVYFGYTHCPDICPATLSAAARARAGLDSSDRDRTRLLMVSVDPRRDDLASLQSYVEHFDPDFLGVGGEGPDIDRVATQYGVFYVLGEGTVETGYTVDHTASLLGIGPDGRLRVVWAPDVGAEELRADIHELLS